MSFYKFIDFEHIDSITKKLQHRWKALLDHNTIDTIPFSYNELDNLVPELTKQFKDNSLELDIARAFVTPPNCSLPIHIDGSETVEKDLALNWPLYNTEKSYMNWYSIVDDQYRIKSDSRYSSHTRVYNKENCKLEESLILQKPALVKIGIPHDVFNFGQFNRIIVSFRFKPEPYQLWDSI